MKASVVKRFGGYPCAHRQWRDDGHCKYLHGYDRWVVLEWVGDRDERGWVVDFGDLADIKKMFDQQFDHTCLIAPDDPEIKIWQELCQRGAIDLRIMDPTMEGMAIWVADQVQRWTTENYPKATLIKVTCWENDKNAAIWNYNTSSL